MGVLKEAMWEIIALLAEFLSVLSKLGGAVLFYRRESFPFGPRFFHFRSIM
jgi:hypothetical protein